MNANHIEGGPSAYSYDFEAHEIIKHALSHEHLDGYERPLKLDELLTISEFRQALGREVATLLWHDQDDEAEEIVKNLKVPEDVLRSDAVHSAALHELSMLETEYPEKIPNIIRLVRILQIPWEDILPEVQEAIQNYGHAPKTSFHDAA